MGVTVERKVANKKRKFLGTLLLTGIISNFSTNVFAAYTVAPKVGQCFNYTNGDVSSDYPLKNPVSCLSKHTAETFYVGKWPLATKPNQLAKDDGLKIADAICGFGNGLSKNVNQKKFNYWAWYTPSDQAWARGERWLRCDWTVSYTHLTLPTKA